MTSGSAPAPNDGAAQRDRTVKVTPREKPASIGRDKAASTSRPVSPAPSSRPGWVWVAIAFVGGLLAMAWIMTNLDRLWPGGEGEGVAGAASTTAVAPAATPELARLADSVDPVTGRTTGASAPVPPSTTEPQTSSAAVGSLTQQVDALEGRLASVRAAADGAAASSSRAEAMLLAFAARRTLDRGVPLGFLQAQLRQRFPAQPRAVDTIVEAAANPVTVESLRAALPTLARRRESRFGGLFSTLAGEGQPLVRLVWGEQTRDDPRSRLEDADAALARGDVDAALALVSGLPATSERVQWARSARRYVAAHQALDVIETAAILQGVGTDAISGLYDLLEPSKRRAVVASTNQGNTT